jgi:hypothetical protein
MVASGVADHYRFFFKKKVAKDQAYSIGDHLLGYHHLKI